MSKHNGGLRPWIVVAVIAVFSTLVLAACSDAPAAEPQIVVQTVVVEKVVEVPVEKVVEVQVVQTVVVERLVTGVDAPPVPQGNIQLLGEKIPPVYGGTLRLALSNDGGINWSSCEFRQTRMLTHSVENFLLGDKRLGPSGTNETTFLPVLSLGTDKIAIGAMADSWDQPDSTTYRFHLRPGLRWQPKNPTNGRLVTVEELADELNRIKDCRWPRHDFLDEVTADDTDGDGIADSVTYHTNKPISFWGYEFAWGPYFLAAPPESIEAGTDNWETQSGTGPWMASAYTAGTTTEFEKNPDWYLTWTEEGREYNLPFMDKLIYIVIPQEANRLAALRTGKIDEIRGVRTIDRPQIEDSNPDLGSVLALESSYNYFMPMDKPPFDDIRVRTAMNYAIDRQVYSDALFGGDSVLLAHPLNPEWPAHYDSLDKQPQSVQDYFVYNPAKAEELLDGAGLTRGSDGVRLTIDMMIGNESQLELELAEISISFWEDIGVIVTLDLVDPPVRQSRLFEKQFEFFAGSVAGRPNALNDFRLGHQWNRANLTDSTFIEMWEDVLTATDSQEQADLIKAASSKWLELAPAVQVPAGFGGDYWQPWVHNHGGERALAFVDYSTHWAYVWLDRDLRAERTGFKD
jgi:peptide/nickel transport system substrate-binding protein